MNQQPGATPPMEPTVCDSLRQLIVRYGHHLCNDPRRCEAMLRDLCGQHKREVFILASALKQRVGADLLGDTDGLPTPLLLGRLRKRLEDELALTGEAAHWAVETWALALGVITEPAIVPAPIPTPVVASQPPSKPAKEAPPSPKPAKEPRQPPLPSFRDRLKDGGEGPEMVRLQPGRFLMGAAAAENCMSHADECPRHEVHIARPFAIGRFPVTFDDYDRFVLATRQPSAAKRGFMERLFGGEGDRQPEVPNNNGWGRSRHPVINVSWNDAVAYCVWLTGQTGRTYRLPSEADWEYACRAGTATRWSCGDDAQALKDYAWFGDNSGGRTHPVGEKRPNPWGLHDIHGNVCEWVQDGWHDDYAGAPTDGSAWGASSDTAGRVLRGGSWWVTAGGVRVSTREGSDPDGCGDNVGLRLAQNL